MAEYKPHMLDLDRMAAEGPGLVYIVPAVSPLQGQGSKLFNLTAESPAPDMTQRERAILAALLVLALQRLTKRNPTTAKD